ncbi:MULTISPECIES: A/G-specific adenine glycosylase [unclassified Beijerinckia]|uniref:A/G-specific adenine glycosylase n=1 Tax=unclassified Beijerinckia TaxID=2638183 RepID=UPI00089B2AA2|nr:MULTISPECIES: A/G-specific adenine glycosylase [unclassified Beijerinckia]MDH7796724.1 A/G-specific adenine glycosylase [Beijerinckia sp. GAS462]SEC57269.1 A/G-specific DNA-adenine glycosylase [Beijerinckia sp. 28-YEA-48]
MVLLANPSKKTRHNIAADLLAWYDAHRRKLPWRALPGQLPDPYAVWLSEIMLQQTTVTAVKPYYEHFLSLWPTVRALAAAPIDDVMKAWAGLGYYSRARNLHACAIAVVERHDSIFPDSEEALRALPGIGPYTAAAIAAIAFDKRAVVVDGNVERVVTRLFAIDAPMPSAKPLIRAKTDTITPDARAGDFAQAMMDLGATICSPKTPACVLCPLADGCIARAEGTQPRFPVKAPKVERPHRTGAIFYTRRADGKVLVRRRPPKGLLGGMLEFPGSEWRADFPQDEALNHAPLTTKWRRKVGSANHVFTHFSLALTVYYGEVPRQTAAPEGAQWIEESELASEALPSVMHKVMQHALDL